MLLRKSQILLKWAVCLGWLLGVCAGAASDPNSPVVLNPQASWTSHDYLRGTVWLSPVVENEVPAPQLTIDGAPAVGWSKDNPYWDSTQVADGLHTFVLTERNKTFEVTLLVLNQPAIHSGTLTEDETWQADQVHLVEYPVTVPAGVTLTIAANAVVKFFDGASLTVDDGGRLVLGNCAFTHLADDTAGGDTNGDGNATAPRNGKYWITVEGEVVKQGFQNVVRYAVSPFLQGNPTIHKDTLETDEMWNAGAVHLVRGAVRVPAGVTLTIADGAVVKFFDDASLTVDDGGRLVLGNCAFTHLADDTVGGDTNWDGTNTTPQAGKYQINTEGDVVTQDFQNVVRYAVSPFLQGNPTIHKDTLETDETWNADTVHLVRGAVRVPAGVTLTIEDGAVVKFFADASLTVNDGGRLVLGNCVLTHLADDTAGGDTNWDGETTAPKDRSYELVLNGEVETIGVQPDIRYAKRTGLVKELTSVYCYPVGKTLVLAEQPEQPVKTLALAGQPVTLTSIHGGTLDGYRLEWNATVPGGRFETVDGNPYQIVFTMPAQDVQVACSLQEILSTSDSGWGTVDTRSTFGGKLLNGVRRISHVAQERDANAYIELLDGDGGFVGEITRENWNSAAVADGWYTATIYEGDENYSAELAVINDPGVAVHGGVLNRNETWGADQVHIVQYLTRVPNGTTLAIAANAVVKVCPGAGFQVDEGGKLVLGDGCVITDIADDSVAGDTNMDATATAPAEEDDGTVFQLADEDALETEGTPEVKVKAPIERAITLLPGWNAMVFDFALDDASTAALQMLRAMELDMERMTYVRPDEFVPNTMYWFFATRVITLKVKGRQEFEELPEKALTSWVPYGNAYGVVPEGCDIYEWRDGVFQRFTGTSFVPGHGYFLLKQE